MRRNIMRRIAIGLLVVMVASAGVPDGANVQAARRLKLNKKKLTLKVGESFHLQVKHTKKKVKWKSLKKKVVTVSTKGVVKARKKGTAKITAQIGKKKLVCKVTVRKKTVDATVAATPAVDKTESYQKKVHKLVNEEREKKGLAPLVLDTALCQVAMLRANELVEKFSHTRPNGTVCFTAVKEAGISYRTIGENIAAGQHTPALVMNGWMNSSGHCANILSSKYGKIGVGYVAKADGYGTYWVQIFTN